MHKAQSFGVKNHVGKHDKRWITGRILGGYISDIDKDRDLHGVSRGRNITNSYTSMRIFRTTGGKLTNKWS